jgi:hypothetical protein
VLKRELEHQDHGAILVFEDSMVRKSNFLVRLPDEVVVTSTSEFLFALQTQGLLNDAAAVLARAVDVRGNEILNRHLAGTSESLEDWPERMGARPVG